MKQTNLRRAVKLTALVLAAGLLMGLVTGCKQKIEPKSQKVTITVKGDEGVTVNEPKTLELVKGTKWSEVKSKVKVSYKDGYEAKGWKLDGASGQDLEDGYAFNENKTVFALSKQKETPATETVTITVKGDANVTVNEPKSFDVIKGSKWSEVKAKIKVSYKDGYEESGWKLGSTSGAYLSDNDVLKENTTVFALSKQIGAPAPETVTITVKGDEGIIVTAENTLKVDKNSKWQDLKEAAKKKITLKNNYEFVEWRLNDKDGEVLTDDYTFAENKTVFALSKKNTPSNPSIFKTDGNGIITGYTCPKGELPKNLVIPAKIGDEVITGIGNGTFFNCNNIESVSFPESLTSIDDWTFAYCFNLASVSFPQSLTSLGYRSFCYCEELTSINIPSKVASIGAGVFAGCTKLTSLTVDDANENYKSVDNIIYTKDMTSLVMAAAGIQSVSIPEGVTSIEDSAFSGCTRLTSVSFPQNLNSIGYWAFEDCEELTSINIPSKVASIGGGVFAGCTKLASLTVDGANENYKSVDNIIYTKDMTSLVIAAGGLESVNIPEGVTSIKDSAFSYCTHLTSIHFPQSLTSINDWAFEYCVELTEAVLPSNLQSIKNGAFSGCKNAEIKLPESITTIEHRVFGSRDSNYCKKVLIKKGTHFERIKALVTGDPCKYPENRIGEYE